MGLDDDLVNSVNGFYADALVAALPLVA